MDEEQEWLLGAGLGLGVNISAVSAECGQLVHLHGNEREGGQAGSMEPFKAWWGGGSRTEQVCPEPPGPQSTAPRPPRAKTQPWLASLAQEIAAQYRTAHTVCVCV